MANAYPELPALPYQRTSVAPTKEEAMRQVVSYLQGADLLAEVKRSTYILFRMESADGMSGVNNNYAGMQADGGRWDSAIDHYFVGTTFAVENGTERTRIFLCFASWQDSVACLASRVAARGLYVGGRTHYITQMDVDSPPTLARAYTKEWVTGTKSAEPSAAASANFLGKYTQAAGFFPPAAETPTLPTPPVTPPVARADPSVEVAILRAALTDITDIIARAQAALAAAAPEPAPAVPNPDNSADDLNARVLAGITGDAA